ncbi:hypothetical protein KR032_008194 [Drosophila birchii]|nr:hypothetical protein KR032_008194 [Drosophila birchii]
MLVPRRGSSDHRRTSGPQHQQRRVSTMDIIAEERNV